jgi:nitrite reductase/ring-hydroxylating ferredoxin subunit
MFFRTRLRWIYLISNSDFLANYVENQIYSINLEGNTILATKFQSELCLFDDTCPHQGFSLKEGLCENGQVICSWHKYAYCLKSGRDLSTSGTSLKIYKVKLENDLWYVGLEDKIPFWMDSI